MFGRIVEFANTLRRRERMRGIRQWETIDGFLSPAEVLALYETARQLPPNAVACEIGVWKGRSAYCLAAGLPAGGKLIAIDPFDASGEPGSHTTYVAKAGGTALIDQFESNMKTLAVRDRIDIKRAYSYDVDAEVGDLDLLFIDGDHSVQACTVDFQKYGPKLKVGGYLLFHDYDSKRKDLGPVFVIESMVYPSLQFQFVGLFDSLWVGKRLS